MCILVGIRPHNWVELTTILSRFLDATYSLLSTPIKTFTLCGKMDLNFRRKRLLNVQNHVALSN